MVILSWSSKAFIHVRDRAWFVRLYGHNPRALASGLTTYRRTTVRYLTCTMISSVDLAHYKVVSRAKDWVSVDYDIKGLNCEKIYFTIRIFLKLCP